MFKDFGSLIPDFTGFEPQKAAVPLSEQNQIFARQARNLFDDSRALDETLKGLDIKPYPGMKQTYLITPDGPGWVPVMKQLAHDLDLLLGKRAGKDFFFLDAINSGTGSLTSIQFIEAMRDVINQAVADGKFNTQTFSPVRALSIPYREIFKNEIYTEHKIQAAPAFSVDVSLDGPDKNPYLFKLSVMSASSGPPLRVFDERIFTLDLSNGAIELETSHYPITSVHTGESTSS